MSRTLFSALLCASTLAFAADTEVVDTQAPRPRDLTAPQGCVPIIACVATLEQRREVVVAVGIDGRSNDGELTSSGQVGVNYRLGSALEAQFVAGQLLVRDHNEPLSLPGVQAGFKVSLLGETSRRPSQAFSLHLTVPTWNPDVTWDFQAWWYLSKSINALRVDLNLMATVSDLGGDPGLQGFGTLTLVTDVGHHLALFSELYGVWGDTVTRLPGGGALLGVGFSPTDELSFDLGGEVDFHQQAPLFTVFAGLTFTPHVHAAAHPTPARRLPNGAIALLER